MTAEAFEGFSRCWALKLHRVETPSHLSIARLAFKAWLYDYDRLYIAHLLSSTTFCKPARMLYESHSS